MRRGGKKGRAREVGARLIGSREMRAWPLFLLLGVGCSSSTSTSSSSESPDAGPDSSVDAGRDVVVVDGGTDTQIPEAARDTAPDATDAPAACKLSSPYSSKNKACNDCAEASCCVEINGCLDDPRCNDDYVNCSLACALTTSVDAGTDAAPVVAACLADCAAKYPAGKALYDTAIGCAESKCKSTCG